MGGGMGLAVGCKYRIGTETLVMGMPETAIGFFPDVGSSSYLMRLPPHPSIGLYYGLTSEKMTLADAMYCGFVTHYIPSDRIEAFVKAIHQLPVVDDKSIQTTINQFCSPHLPVSELSKQVEDIKKCFCFESVEEIVNKLREMAHTERNSSTRKWCKQTLYTILTKSPTSLKVAMKALKDSKNLTQEEIYALDYRLAARLVKSHDFKEGVRAMLIDKDRRPKWNPSRVEEVPDEYIDSFFEPFEKLNEWYPPSKL